MTPTAAPPHPSTKRRVALDAARDGALVLLSLSCLTAAFTWPLVLHPGYLPGENHDAYGHVWGLAWVVRQLSAAPLEIYDANMYWPHTLTLAYTESLLPQSMMAAPLFWMGLEPIAVHNILVLATFPMSGLFTFLLARDLGAGRSGSMLAAIGYAFCSFRWDHFVHLGVLSTQWLPLVLLFLGRCLKNASAWNLLALFLTFVAQALSSGYYAVLVALCSGAALATWVVQKRGGGFWKATALCLLLATSACWLAGMPYRTIQARMPGQRTGSPGWSATLASYLDPGPSGRFYPSAIDSLRRTGEPLSPGLLVVGLGALGVVTSVRRGRHRWLLVIGATTLALSLGPELRDFGGIPGPYAAIQGVPPVDMMRAPARLGIGAVLVLALFAAIGLTTAAAGRSGKWSWVAVLLAAIETAPRPLPLGPPLPVPESSDWLRAAPRGPVLELPWPAEDEGGRSMYWSTRHWQPMVNGHGTFPARGNLGAGFVGAMFPRPYAARTLRCSGIRYLVVHTALLQADARRSFEAGLGELPPFVRLAQVSADSYRSMTFDLLPASADECSRHWRRFPDSRLFPSEE